MNCEVCGAQAIGGITVCVACGQPLHEEARVTPLMHVVDLMNATTVAREYTRLMTFAGCLEKAGDYPEAVKVYASIIEQPLQFSAPFQRLAILYRRLNKPELEEKVVRQALARLSSHTTPWFTLRLAGILAKQRKS